MVPNELRQRDPWVEAPIESITYRVFGLRERHQRPVEKPEIGR